jgi:hypothetical protein
VCHSRLDTIGLQGGAGHEDDWEFNDEAQRHLFPGHWMNSLALLVSLSGFLMWLFYSPHMHFEDAARLDHTCGAFFAASLVGNLFVTGTNMFICTSNETVYEVLVLLYILTTFGVSIIWSNICCHRYLLEKAVTMTNM